MGARPVAEQGARGGATPRSSRRAADGATFRPLAGHARRPSCSPRRGPSPVPSSRRLPGVRQPVGPHPAGGLRRMRPRFSGRRSLRGASPCNCTTGPSGRGSACATGLGCNHASARRARPGRRMAPARRHLAQPRGQRRRRRSRRRSRRVTGLVYRRHTRAAVDAARRYPRLVVPSSATFACAMKLASISAAPL